MTRYNYKTLSAEAQTYSYRYAIGMTKAEWATFCDQHNLEFNEVGQQWVGNDLALINDYPELTESKLNEIAGLMDDSIREEIHSDLAPCHPGEFLTAYADRDPAIKGVLRDYDIE